MIFQSCPFVPLISLVSSLASQNAWLVLWLNHSSILPLSFAFLFESWLIREWVLLQLYVKKKLYLPRLWHKSIFVNAFWYVKSQQLKTSVYTIVNPLGLVLYVWLGLASIGSKASSAPVLLFSHSFSFCLTFSLFLA